MKVLALPPPTLLAFIVSLQRKILNAGWVPPRSPWLEPLPRNATCVQRLPLQGNLEYEGGQGRDK